jgi:hypothetical protein
LRGLNLSPFPKFLSQKKLNNMDIKTPKGKITREDESRAAEIFHHHYPEYRYLETPKDEPALVDALIVCGSVIHSVVETKCRYGLTVEYFMNAFEGSWLITFDKLEQARKIAVSLGVGLSGFLYLKEDDALLITTISDKTGLFKQRVYVESTETQRTVNGGTAVRNNAFIDMKNAKVLRMN